ncbi:MAG: hypothetical protein VKI81_05490 [Synechococcaceae cyanobacterium]|nr:hypothetical protein [Synechococcaceae cyanobacterium]
MASNDQASPINLSIVRDTRDRLAEDEHRRRSIMAFEARMSAEVAATHRMYVEQLKAKHGLDLSDIQADARRRNKVKDRITTRFYREQLSALRECVRERQKRLSNTRSIYLSYHGDAIKKRAGNPELKFLEAVAGSARSDVYHDDPGGMVGGSGCHEPRLSRREVSDEIAIGYLPPDELDGHYFFPRVFVRTGDDDRQVNTKLVQSVFLRRPPLARGRGNFEVSRVRVDLSGVGYSRARLPDSPECPISIGGGGTRVTTTCIKLSLHVHQNTPRGLMVHPLFEGACTGGMCDCPGIHLGGGANSHSHPLDIHLATRIDSRDFRLLSPDEGGSEPWLLVVLETEVKAEGDNSFAEISFAREDSEGLRLGCVTLLGEYDR